MMVPSNKLKVRVAMVAVVASLCSWAYALDVEKPDPITYQWTVSRAQTVLPKVDVTDTKIEDLIGFLNNGMSTPIKIKHELPKDKLDIKVTWNLKEISYLELAAKIADVTDSKLTVEKGFLKLTPNPAP